MTYFLGSILAIGFSTAALVFAAGKSLFFVHLGLAVFTALLLAGSAFLETAKAKKVGASQSAIAAIVARHMGLVYAWGALALLATYTIVLSWKEWWQFFIGFAAAAGLCLVFSRAIGNDAGEGGEDQSMLKLARYLAIGQLVAMIITLVGLPIDGKMTRYLNPRYTDWAGQYVFFAGALALALVSIVALRAQAQAKGQSGDAS